MTARVLPYLVSGLGGESRMQGLPGGFPPRQAFGPASGGFQGS
jgi:hypothetical protein